MTSRVAVIVFLSVIMVGRVRGASAVAVGTDPKTNTPTFGYYKGGDISEAEAKSRALAFCRASDGKDCRIVASTTRRGFGVVMAYYANGKLKYAVALAAPTQERAALDAIRQARLQAAKEAWIVQMWVDN